MARARYLEVVANDPLPLSVLDQISPQLPAMKLILDFIREYDFMGLNGATIVKVRFVKYLFILCLFTLVVLSIQLVSVKIVLMQLSNDDGTVTGHYSGWQTGRIISAVPALATTPTVTATLTNTPEPSLEWEVFLPIFVKNWSSSSLPPTLTPTETSTPIPDLSASRKMADCDTVYYFQPVYYTIELHNSGPGVATNVRITDVVPSRLTYLDGTVSGNAVYHSETDTITWAGSLASGETHTISFGCHGPQPIIPHDTLITNEVVIDDGVHALFIRSVTIIANPWPTPTPTPTFTPTPTDTPTLPLTGYTVSGHVAEFPPCFGNMRGVTVILDPTGRATTTDLSMARFSFDQVPDGDYTLVILPSCNPYGCWPETPMTVAGEDVFVQICPVAHPTPTFTLAPTHTPLSTFMSIPIPTDTPLPTLPQEAGRHFGNEERLPNENVGAREP